MKKSIKIQNNKGMTYVELIVVLSIFSIMASVVLFNYGDFQAKVDIKNLASDIALKIVEAQKSSLAGKLPPPTSQYTFDSTSWKPSYGVYFSTTANSNIDNKSFIYFTDLDGLYNADTEESVQDGIFGASGAGCTGECLDKITITKGDIISKLELCYQVDVSSNPCPLGSLDDLAITFSRPNSGATLVSDGLKLVGVSYVQITILSPKSVSSIIKLYPSGRIELN